MILVTTVRGPDQKTRKLGRIIANFIPHSRYVPRGKSNLNKIIGCARILGHRRVAILSGEKIQFISVTPDSWEWDRRIVIFKNLKFSEFKGRPPDIKITGAAAELFDVESGESDFIFEAGQKHWVFKHGKDNILSADVKIEEV